MLVDDTMELFVYTWVYNGYTIYGHCLDPNGSHVCIKVQDFFPSCYIEGDTVPRSTVIPRAAKFQRMLSSKDISRLQPFYRLYFDNASDLTSFSKEHSYKCYMADIPQVATFLSQINADHVGWVKVTSTSADSTLQTTVRMKNIQSIPNKIPPCTPRVMAFDIEVKSIDSGMPQPHRIKDTVEMISVVIFGAEKPTEKFIMHMFKPFCIDGVQDITFITEIELIVGFFNLMKDKDPTIVTGFNIYGFDMHYLVSRLKLRLVEIPPAHRGTSGTVDVIKVDWSSEAYGHNSYDRLVIGGRVIVDMYLYFKRMKLDKYSLDFVSAKFIGEGKNDMPYKDMAGAFLSGDHAALCKVAQYCVQDSVLVMKLFDKVQMWIDMCEISKITRCGIEDIYTRGEQMKMVSQCVAECERRNIVLQPQKPSNWKQYEGAYVLEPTKGVYDGCSIVDFQSLYPSIIIAYNICPSTYAAHGDIRIGDHGFRSTPIGLLPGMIKRILEERKQVKAQMKVISNARSVEYIVLDRRQNALKICANSVYGMMGFQSSRYFGHLGCAESVTTAGRLLLSETVHTINNNYPVEVLYGDSVVGYTPTIVRICKKFIFLETFENLAAKWGHDRWVKCYESEKEICELHDVEVWTDIGWTKMHRVIRHVLQPHKKIVRVVTHTGIVDVTNEHSLLDVYGEPVDAECVQIGDELMHYPYPDFIENEIGISPMEAQILGMFCGGGTCGTCDCPSWAINNADLGLLLKYRLLCKSVYTDNNWTILNTLTSTPRQTTPSVVCEVSGVGVYKLVPQGDIITITKRYRSMMYRDKEKTVPQEIFNSSLETRQAFWNGLYDADGNKEGCIIDQKHQITIASLAMLASSIGYNISLNTRPNIFRLTTTKNKASQKIKKICNVEYTGYVYDVTTGNGHFQAGPGKLIVHNTDSCMFWHNDDTNEISRTHVAKRICDDITASLPEPMALQFETYCDKVILLSKKRYILVTGDKISYKGVMNARRDYCKYAKDTYSKTLEIVAKGKDQKEISDYIDMRILVLLSGKAKASDLIVTKSLAKRLSAYKVSQPHVVLARRLVGKTGVDIPAGTRLEYIYIKDSDIRMVTPDEFNAGGFEADGRLYVEKQLATQVDDVLSAIGMGNYISDEWLH